MKNTKFIFITGGVVSSLGKGLTAAAIGALLESRGLSVTIQKLDPYINVDPGTMSPFQHGEVFVTDDGAETDLDMGHYERFTSARLGKINNATTGKIYNTVISRERAGEYLGQTIQIVPHITDEVKNNVVAAAKGHDIIIVEIGGTIGDIEAMPFLEAIRQMRGSLGRDNTLFVHLSYVPYIAAAGEMKTKPTQHSVKELLGIGIQPDIIICRAERELSDEIKGKISLFCNIDKTAVIAAKDVGCIYELPVELHKEGLDSKILELMHIWTATPNLGPWEEVVSRNKSPKYKTRIAIVGKYVELLDAYKSLNEALFHGGMANNTRVELKYVDSESINMKNIDSLLKDINAVLIPGGFGTRGIEGKILAVRYARENKIPFLGICLGMQVAMIEFGRNVLGLADADSTEFNKNTSEPIINLISEWQDYRSGAIQSRDIDSAKGGTMRLGSYPCEIVREDTVAFQAYGDRSINERHRHRYEFNNEYREALQQAGMIVSGQSPDGQLVEIVELDKSFNHPWFLGCQFHPEYKSKPLTPHPIFAGFVKAALRKVKVENECIDAKYAA